MLILGIYMYVDTGEISLAAQNPCMHTSRDPNCTRGASVYRCSLLRKKTLWLSLRQNDRCSRLVMPLTRSLRCLFLSLCATPLEAFGGLSYLRTPTNGALTTGPNGVLDYGLDIRDEMVNAPP